MVSRIEPATQLFWDCDEAFAVDRHEQTGINPAFEYDAALVHAFLEMIEDVRSQMGDAAADAMIETVAENMSRYGYECPVIEGTDDELEP